MQKIHEEIRSAFFEYLEVYLSKRDIEATIKMFNPDVTGYGTGFDEKGYSLKEAVDLYRRDIAQAANPVFYEIKKLHINAPSENTGVLSCELNFKTRIMDQELKLNNLRLSIFWVKSNQKWLIYHTHTSFPTDAHEENESYPIKELEERNKVLQRLVDEKTKELQNAITEITKLAATDKLTGLFNRLKLEESMESELLRSNRYNNDFSIVLMDIDYFKKVNDTFGHLVGDKVLVEFSDIISRRTRKTDVCGRWGGEEFMIICPETALREAAKLAETIRHAVELHEFEVVGQKTASFGVSSHRKNDTLDDIINRADEALYYAKNKGRNQVISK